MFASDSAPGVQSSTRLSGSRGLGLALQWPHAPAGDAQFLHAGSILSLSYSFPDHLRDLEHDLGSSSVGTRAYLTLDRADAVVEPAVVWIIGRVDQAAEQESPA